MKPEQQEKMCAVCQCEMEHGSIAKIECCTHQFCFDCIKHWGTTCANTCPLCKKRFNSIKHKNEKGEEQELKVLTRN